MLMTEEKDLKTVNHPPVSMAAFLLGWPLTISHFLLFFYAFPAVDKRTTNTHSTDSVKFVKTDKLP